MKNIGFICTAILSLLGAATVFGKEKLEQNRSWADHLEYVGIAVEEPGYHVWGSSPVIGPEGKTHLFVSRWPVKDKFSAWITHCEIARYVSDSPEGPFVFQDIVLKGTDMDTWDRKSPHNPNVQKVGEQYVLFHIANAGGGKKERVASQRIGVIGNMDYQRITLKHGELYRQHCLDHGNTPATVSKKLRHLKRFFTLAVDRKQLDENLLRQVKSPRSPKKRSKLTPARSASVF